MRRDQTVNRMQRQVTDFHRLLEIPIGYRPKIRRGDLRTRLIYEEADEFASAVEAGDLPEAIDGLCDLIYVALGAAVEFGVDLEPFFDEVHLSNLRKAGGPKRADGKALKPEGWTKPQIAALLKAGVGGIR